MSSFAPISRIVNCKVNLGLNILRKRTDGFHDLQTVFYPTDFFTDRLTLEPSPEELEFVCDARCDIGPAEHNLVVRTFRLLQRDFGIAGARITLEKNIPTGAGLGGGSADAAFTLRMLAEAFRLPLSDGQLKAYAAQLGSDVPFFIDNRPMFATGRGEILTPVALDLSNYLIRIVKPDVSVSTKEAYAGITPQLSRVDLPAAVRRPVSEWKSMVTNDFEPSIFAKYPELAGIKARLYDEGALYAAMSGSGTALFGIFKRNA